MTNWHLQRRDLLRGLGVGLACLPVLQAKNAFGQTEVKASKKLMVLQMSEGYRQQYWKPATGPLNALPPTLVPLEAHKQDMIILPDMSNPGIGAGGHGSYGVIYYGKGATGGGYVQPSGPTFDQVAANGLPKSDSGRKSIHTWVQLHLPPLPTTSLGGTRCFWAGPGQPMNPIGDPYVLYKEIFAGGDFNSAAADPEAVKRLMNRKKSILDFVGANLDDFRKRLGTEDRTSIEGHFGAIRELEKQLQASATSGGGGGACSGDPGMLDIDDRTNYPKIQKAHMGLLVSALKCGVTNVVTLQHGDSSGNSINFGAFVPGLPALSKNNYKSPWRNWHDLGHSPIQDGTDHKKLVDAWFMARFAELVADMKNVPGEHGTLFDNTCIVIGNHMQEGANHDAQKNPMMVLAGKNLGLATGQCVASAGKGVGTLYADVLSALGVPHTYGVGIGIKKG
jgi:Protein of unknown function (DUF1552)